MSAAVSGNGIGRWKIKKMICFVFYLICFLDPSEAETQLADDYDKWWSPEKSNRLGSDDNYLSSLSTR